MGQLEGWTESHSSGDEGSPLGCGRSGTRYPRGLSSDVSALLEHSGLVSLMLSFTISDTLCSSFSRITALGAFVASSESELADVECFSSSDADAEPIDIPGCKFSIEFSYAWARRSDRRMSFAPVNTETYHAQYRVLEAFSFFNMILSKFPSPRYFCEYSDG